MGAFLSYLIAYVGAAAVMTGLDLIWLKLAADRVYHPAIGALLAEHANHAAAAAFYLVFVTGIVIFGVSPALQSDRWWTAFFHGALFGFFAYATYDLTNLATLSGWTSRLALIDLSWGTLVSALSSTAGYLLVHALRYV